MKNPEKNSPDTIIAEEVLLGLNTIFPIVKHLYGVRKIGIFGRFARGEENNQGPAELLVEFSPGSESYRTYLDCKHYLEERLKIRICLVTTRVYSEGEYTKRREQKDSSGDEHPVKELIRNFEILHARCGGISVEAFSRDTELRRFAEECMETAGMLVRKIDPETKTAGMGIPWDEIDEIGADITCSGYPADPHLLWHYIKSDIPVILGKLPGLG